MFKRKPLIAFVILVILSVSAIPMVKLRNDVQAQTSEMARQPTPAALRPLVSTSTSKAAPPTSTTPSKTTPKAKPVKGDEATDAGMEAWQVPGLELDAPQKRTRPGLAFVNAKVVAKPEAKKVVILWRVEGIWEDAQEQTVIEKRDQGKRLQIVIPDVSGVVRISAWAVVDGEPTYGERPAETLIEMNYQPRKNEAEGTGKKTSSGGTPGGQSDERRGLGLSAQARSDPPASAGSTTSPIAPLTGAGKVTDVYFVIDKSNPEHATVNDLAGSVSLRNRLRATGIKPHAFDRSSAEGQVVIDRNGLAPYVQDAGGVPCMILVTGDRKVRKAIKCPSTVEGVMEALK